MMRCVASWLLVLLFTSSTFGVSEASLPDPAFVRFHFKDLVETKQKPLLRYPSLVVVLVTPTEVRVDPLGKGEITNKSIIEVGSLTKPVTALVAASLVEEKVLAEDTPLSRMWSGASLRNDGREIHLRHLVTHTSGLPRLPEPFRSKDPMQPYREFDGVALLQSIQNVRFEGPAETAVLYSNWGYGLLGHALAQARGTTLDGLMTERIFQPLAMEDSSLRVESRWRDRMVRGFNWENGPTEFWEFSAMEGLGALKTSPDDMARFFQAQLEPASAPRLFAALERSQKTLFEPGGVAWGWFEARTPEGKKFLWHNGGSYGFTCFGGFSREEKKALFVCGNALRIVKDHLDTRIDDLSVRLLSKWVDGQPLVVPPPKPKARAKKKAPAKKSKTTSSPQTKR